MDYIVKFKYVEDKFVCSKDNSICLREKCKNFYSLDSLGLITDLCPYIIKVLHYDINGEDIRLEVPASIASNVINVDKDGIAIVKFFDDLQAIKSHIEDGYPAHFLDYRECYPFFNLKEKREYELEAMYIDMNLQERLAVTKDNPTIALVSKVFSITRYKAKKLLNENPEQIDEFLRLCKTIDWKKVNRYLEFDKVYTELLKDEQNNEQKND